jgi:hypothetical protein
LPFALSLPPSLLPSRNTKAIYLDIARRAHRRQCRHSRLAEIDKTLVVNDVTLRENPQKLRPLLEPASPTAQTRNWLPCEGRRGRLSCQEEGLDRTLARAWHKGVSARVKDSRQFRVTAASPGRGPRGDYAGESVPSVSIVKGDTGTANPVASRLLLCRCRGVAPQRKGSDWGFGSAQQ